MAKLLCALVFAGLVFQASAWDWNPTHWIPNISIPNPFKWISNHTGWISKLNPLNWFGGNCDHCSLQAFPGPCYGWIDRFYYDVNLGICKPFKYSGCKGNKNNFLTTEDCEKSCRKH
ncbi:hypothetical protein TNIN_257221 [Trichonephila inaurata madagascariensis]|uniref:BPTI/Kunitz inhibitor domain-containing protein n=1 Tax=Trichonephila inaurata madagascariensis TaxID=2747483 RepID=A0A8X6YV51_9ARAC|nr:hypothetical protein TNIN_257221 [Trichonephila inaurata madagascariensis]